LSTIVYHAFQFSKVLFETGLPSSTPNICLAHKDRNCAGLNYSRPEERVWINVRRMSKRQHDVPYPGLSEQPSPEK
jgi:hypothetical protein